MDSSNRFCRNGTPHPNRPVMWEPPTKEGLHSAARQPQRSQADGTVKREAIHPETHRVAQARAWKAKTEAAKIRREINVTQEGFARMLGVSLGTVRKWERGTIQPSGAARTLLKIAAKHPEIVREAVG